MRKLRRQQNLTRIEPLAESETSADEVRKAASNSQDFAEIVWKYFRTEIEESLAEVEDALRQNTSAERYQGHEDD
jgi:hypothetical protein